MPSHFSTIGLPVQSNDDLLALADQIATLSERVRADNGYYLRWSSGIGAEVWLQMDRRDQCVGITPYFEAKSVFRVAVTTDVSRSDDTALEGAVHCWANPINGVTDAGDYPFVFDVIDRDRYRRLEYPFASDVRLCAFAHELSTYASEQEYEANSDQPRFAPESFIPSGLFAPAGEVTRPPASEAIFTGRVLDAAVLRNPLTAHEFNWFHVKTLGGQIDVVCDPDLICTPVPKGGIISGSFWLCGRILQPRRRGVLRRLFRGEA